MVCMYVCMYVTYLFGIALVCTLSIWHSADWIHDLYKPQYLTLVYWGHVTYINTLHYILHLIDYITTIHYWLYITYSNLIPWVSRWTSGIHDTMNSWYSWYNEEHQVLSIRYDPTGRVDGVDTGSTCRNKR